MTWKEFHNAESAKPYYNDLYNYVKHEYDTTTCYPPFDKILNALSLTPYDNVKCVILGQDPYHEPNQAMGLSFSVEKSMPIPKSLQNIYAEINSEFGYPIPSHGDLTSWAKQGVLLLNSILTVRAHDAASHANVGWETYTDAILAELNKNPNPIVYMLWGNYAKSKAVLLNNPNHLVMTAVHPSPLSAHRGFFGCNHFKKCNEYLIAHGAAPIDWQIK